MALPLIGITTARVLNNSNIHIMSAAEAYVQAVYKAGGLPVLIPLGIADADLAALLERLDGLLFTGGGDIDPERYGGQPHPRVYDIDPDRDRTELYLVERAAKQGLPFLGICRGFQVINVAFGGGLYEDILDQHPGALKHDYFPGYPRDLLVHKVQITPGSRLAEILGQTEVEVNSLHHQGVRQVPAALHTTAVAPDGIPEAVELPNHPFGLAVQWHPEWLQAYAPMRRLFEAFVGQVTHIGSKSPYSSYRGIRRVTMPAQYTFRAVIEDAGDGGAYVTIPFDVEHAFGKKRVKVLATIEDVAYRGSLVRMGGECHLLPVLKEIRQQTGKSIGDEIEVTVVEYTQPRQVAAPADLTQALAADSTAQAFFARLSYTHQKEYVQWIEEAKRPQTRQSRIVKMVDLLTQGKREHE
jgi:putative glutamine amidotransferase